MGSTSQAPLGVALLAGLLLSLAAGAEWDYTGPHGTDHWPGICRNGSYQSPMDIGGNGIESRTFEPLALINYHGERNMTVTNNGHTVQLEVQHLNIPTITAGGLRGVFLLDQCHFHWESEHTLQGNRYPLELHFVHHERRFANLKKALTDDEGITVLAVLFHESEAANLDLDPLIEGIRFVNDRTYSTQHLRRPLRLHALLPDDINSFYRYHGSLTTPGCDESVVWTVFTETIPISKQQLNSFYKVRSSNNNILKFNYRPVQEQNDRIVYFQSGPPPRITWVSSAECRSGTTAAFLALLFVGLRLLQELNVYSL